MSTALIDEKLANFLVTSGIEPSYILIHYDDYQELEQVFLQYIRTPKLETVYVK